MRFPAMYVQQNETSSIQIPSYGGIANLADLFDAVGLNDVLRIRLRAQCLNSAISSRPAGAWTLLFRGRNVES